MLDTSGPALRLCRYLAIGHQILLSSGATSAAVPAHPVVRLLHSQRRARVRVGSKHPAFEVEPMPKSAKALRRKQLFERGGDRPPKRASAFRKNERRPNRLLAIRRHAPGRS